MNEKHMGVVERALLNLSESRRKLRVSADELRSDGADAHLIEALEKAEQDLEATYKATFQATYFHVSEADMASAGASGPAESVAAARTGAKKVDVPEPADELRLFKGDDALNPLKK